MACITAYARETEGFTTGGTGNTGTAMALQSLCPLCPLW